MLPVNKANMPPEWVMQIYNHSPDIDDNLDFIASDDYITFNSKKLNKIEIPILKLVMKSLKQRGWNNISNAFCYMNNIAILEFSSDDQLWNPVTVFRVSMDYNIINISLYILHDINCAEINLSDGDFCDSISKFHSDKLNKYRIKRLSKKINKASPKKQNNISEIDAVIEAINIGLIDYIKMNYTTH